MNFRSELFLDPEQYEEVPLRDRKVDFPNLQKRSGNPEKKAEFIRDVIALANTARLWGKPAYLLFGIDDSGRIAGVEAYLEAYRRSEEWSRSSIQEEARKQVGSLIKEYIKPKLAKFDLRFGEVDRLLVAYLLIEPMSPPNGPFRSAKQFDNGIRQPIAENDCWIRMGESKDKVSLQEIAPDEDPYCYAYDSVPYILPSHWELYLKNLQNEPQLRDAYTIGTYVEPFIELGESLDSVVDVFLHSEEHCLLLLWGPAGSGKTTFLERHAFRQAENGLFALEGIRKREEFLPPPERIPVFVRLRYHGRRVESIARFIGHITDHIGKLGGFWKTRPSMPERLLETNSLRWLVYLDGFDELTDNAQRRFVETISEFLQRFPHIKVILTSRPITIATDWVQAANAKEETLRPLTGDDIRSFINGYAGGAQSMLTASEVRALEEARVEAMRFIESHPDIRQLCSFPSYLIATAREFFPSVDDAPRDKPVPHLVPQNVELDVEYDDLPDDAISIPAALASDEFRLTQPFSDEQSEAERIIEEEPAIKIRTGIILKEIYRYLWERESERWGINPVEFRQRWESTGLLALKTDGRQITFRQEDALRKLRTQSTLRWLLTLGILECGPNLTLRFITELTKAFFAASVVVSWIEVDDYRINVIKLRDKEVFKGRECGRKGSFCGKLNRMDEGCFRS